MSRLDEAAKAGIEEWNRVEPNHPVSASYVASHVDSIRAALAAAEAHDTSNGVHRVSLDEATVGRVMNALYEHRERGLTCYDHIPMSDAKAWCCVCGEHEITVSHRQHMARAVLAAAVKEEQ